MQYRPTHFKRQHSKHALDTDSVMLIGCSGRAHLPFFFCDLPACPRAAGALTVLLLVVLGGTIGRTGGRPSIPGTLPRPGDELVDGGAAWLGRCSESSSSL